MFYILDEDNNPVTVDWHETTWRDFLASDKRQLFDARVGDIRVSTVFLGIDHNHSTEGNPILFETMIFGGELDEAMWRYRTYDEAEKGHTYACGLAFQSLSE